MLLQNHIKCGACLEYFVLVLCLSYVSPVLIDLHNIRQCPPTLQVQANNFCCLSFFTSPVLKGWTCTVSGISANQFWLQQDEAGSWLLARTVFSLFSLKGVLPSPKYHSKSIVKHPCFLRKYVQQVYLTYLNNAAGFYNLKLHGTLSDFFILGEVSIQGTLYNI